MNDDALIRLSNLKALGLTAKLLEQQVGGRYTYWRDLLAGQKSFGEKIARKIEEAMEYPRGYLDQVMDKRENDWPFSTLTMEQLRGLPTEYLLTIERHALDLVSLAKTPIRAQEKHLDTDGSSESDLVVLTAKLPVKGSSSDRPDTDTGQSAERRKRLQGNS